MNTLSWLIYAADVAGSINFSFDFFGYISILAGIGLFIPGHIAWIKFSSGDEWDGLMANRALMAKSSKRLLILGFLFIIVQSFTPSSAALYRIAASEVGEMAVTSPEAKEMLGDLKSIIKSKLKAELEPKQ